MDSVGEQCCSERIAGKAFVPDAVELERQHMRAIDDSAARKAKDSVTVRPAATGRRTRRSRGCRACACRAER
jgi:hypothetical protein